MVLSLLRPMLREKEPHPYGRPIQGSLDQDLVSYSMVIFHYLTDGPLVSDVLNLTTYALHPDWFDLLDRTFYHISEIVCQGSGAAVVDGNIDRVRVVALRLWRWRC